ncbi:MAG: hypothetical protein IPP39_07505 [Chitinophagaceae bacterium]|nr:hypothetical protein [Chitinophagaceae bacterium]
MKKLVIVILLVSVFQADVRAQFPDTLTIVEITDGAPNAYKIIFESKGNGYSITYGSRSEKSEFSEVKNGLSRIVVKDERGQYALYLLKQLGRGSYIFLETRLIDSLNQAKVFLPDEKLFNLAFTREGLADYFKRPQLKSITKTEALAFLAYQHSSFEALKIYADNLVKITSLKKNMGNKEVYQSFRDKIQELVYLRWLNAKGYNGGSYMSLSFEVFGYLIDKEVEKKVIDYTAKENAFY